MDRKTSRVVTVSVKRRALAAGLLLEAGPVGCGGDSGASGERAEPASPEWATDSTTN